MKFKKPHILFIILFAILQSCGPEGELSSAKLKTGQGIDLIAEDGSVPVRLTFEEAPTSSLGTSSDKTVGVTFEGDLDLRLANSPSAYNAIQGAAEILLELRFIDTNRQEKKIVLPPIKQNEPLARHIVRDTVPLALEEIAKIIFVVDGKEIGFYPPLSTKK